MPKKKHAKIGTQGRMIMSEARKIRNAHTNMTWPNCVKAAAHKLFK